jgi:hypothetical protein
VVDVFRAVVVGGVETGRRRIVVLGDVDATGCGSGAGAFVEEGVDTGRAAGTDEAADDVPRTGDATGVCEDGAIT